MLGFRSSEGWPDLPETAVIVFSFSEIPRGLRRRACNIQMIANMAGTRRVSGVRFIGISALRAPGSVSIAHIA